jgi:hypothetical protein
MSVRHFLKSVLSGLALTSMLTANSPLFGDDFPVSRLNRTGVEPSQRKEEIYSLSRRMTEVNDVALDDRGILHGSFVDQLGLPLLGTQVIARQGKTKTRKAITNGAGTFQLTGLKGGIWSITVGSQSTLYRVWAPGIAPPIAKSRLIVIKRALAIRGQSEEEEEGMLAAFDNGTLFSIGAGLAGITLGTIGISEASETNDEADALRRELNTLSATVDAISATLN